MVFLIELRFSFKKRESLSFDYQPHYGGVPDDIGREIFTKLTFAKTADDIKAAFEVSHIAAITHQPTSEIKQLADAINKLAESKNA